MTGRIGCIHLKFHTDSFDVFLRVVSFGGVTDIASVRTGSAIECYVVEGSGSGGIGSVEGDCCIDGIDYRGPAVRSVPVIIADRIQLRTGHLVIRPTSDGLTER